jgi:hypothetical protein
LRAVSYWAQGSRRLRGPRASSAGSPPLASQAASNNSETAQPASPPGGKRGGRRSEGSSVARSTARRRRRCVATVRGCLRDPPMTSGSSRRSAAVRTCSSSRRDTRRSRRKKMGTPLKGGVPVDGGTRTRIPAVWGRWPTIGRRLPGPIAHGREVARGRHLITVSYHWTTEFQSGGDSNPRLRVTSGEDPPPCESRPV